MSLSNGHHSLEQCYFVLCTETRLLSSLGWPARDRDLTGRVCTKVHREGMCELTTYDGELSYVVLTHAPTLLQGVGVVRRVHVVHKTGQKCGA
jgi:hypothetical protein